MTKENPSLEEKTDKLFKKNWLMFFFALVTFVFVLCLMQTHFLSNVVTNERAGKVRAAHFAAYPKTLQDAILTDKDVWLYVDHGYIYVAIGQELTLTTYDSGLTRLCSTREESECAYVRRTCLQDAKTQLPGACVNARFPFTQKVFQSWVRPLFTFVGA